MSRQLKRRSSRIVAAERRVKAMGLRRAGATYEQIASVLEVSEQTARKYVKEGLDTLNTELRETAAEVKRLETERLDEMVRILWPLVRKGDLAAMDRVIRIQERRAKLEGLDSPQKHQHSGNVNHTLEGVSRQDVEELEAVWQETIDSQASEIPEAELLEAGDDEDDFPDEEE